MSIKTSTLRPGLLVSLKTHLSGNVTYTKRTIEAAHVVRGGLEKARWETERTVSDPKELEAAKSARSKAAQLIRSVCAHSAFGLLCPDNAEEDLETAIAAARQVAEDFNATAKLSRVSVYVITGRIAPDDVEAVRAINSEVRDLLEDMKQGVKNIDVKAIREAANKARNLGAMLSPDAEARIKIAIEAARKAARQIAKAGETAAQEVDRFAIRKITEQRTAFLDLDDAREIATPAASSRALDFSPSRPVKSPKTAARSIEV